MDRSPRAAQSLRYLYAIADGLATSWRPPREGVDGAPVSRASVAGLALVASPIAATPIRTPRSEARHQEIVASLLDARAVLPFTFGTVVPDGQLDAWIAARLTAMRAGLRDVSGCVEMTVRLLSLEGRRPREPRPGNGDRLRALAARLVERAGLPHWRYRATPRGDEWAASLVFLVPRGDVPTFLTSIAPVAARAEGLAVVPSAPSAPYSFTPSFDDDLAAVRAG